MKDFDDTFNLIIGTTDSTIEWFDNPYIEVNIIDLAQDFKPTISKDIFLRKCDLEKDLLKFMPRNVGKYYPNALCFNNKNDIKL